MITTEAIQNSILDSINEITQHAIDQAKFDKTVIGVVIECVDDIVGKYKIKYQDAVYYATAESTDKKYIKGTEVYILIPDGDFSKAKKIVGAVTENADSFYASINADKYVGIGVNCLKPTGTEPLVLDNSTDLIEIYNHYYFDETDFKNYLKNSNAVRLSAKFKTSGLTRASVFNYGLILKIKDKENNILSYSFDTDSMLGTPYSFNNFSKQSIDLSIDSEIFESLESIFFFQEGLEENQSVACTDVELICLQKITTEENDKSNSMTLSLSTPLGSILRDGTDKIRLEANVIYKGKLVNVDKIEAYWFKENAEVTIDHNNYNRHGGQGWECLSKVPDEDLIHEISISDVSLYEQKYKCVCIYNNVVLSQVISVYNDKGIKMELKSSGGQYFKSNTGSTEIACSLKGENYTYSWSKTSAGGTYTIISSKPEKSSINIKVAELDANTTIKCAIYEKVHDEKNNIDKEEYIGTASINLTKILSKETKGVSIIVENSNQIFKYNANGYAPNHKSLTTKQTLYPLKFKVFDENGRDITDAVSASWYVPMKNTLLKIEDENVQNDDNYYIINDNNKELVFNIKDRFNINAINNIIELKITYLGSIYTESIKMIFTKDGMNGTNGTGYYCDIIAVDKDDQEIVGEPILYIDKDNNIKIGEIPQQGDTTFKLKAVLYNKDEVVTEDLSYSWKVLNNKGENVFSPNISDEQISEWKLVNYDNDNSLIQVTITYQGQQYYKVLPMDMVIGATSVEDVKWSGGTKEVLYSSDGYSPQYSNEPLSFEKGTVKEYWYQGSNIINRNNGNLKLDNKRYNGLNTNHKIIVTLNNGIKVILPIYFHLNTYELDSINGWDGTGIKLSDDYILTPQVGAGKKDSSNTFTGMVMGTVSKNENDEKVGLFGYNQGMQSLFLNAEDGSAIFGKNEEIKIIPEGKKVKVQIGGWNVEENSLWITTQEKPDWETAFKQLNSIYLGWHEFQKDGKLRPAFSLGDGLFYDGETLTVNMTEKQTNKITISTGSIAGWTAEENRFKIGENNSYHAYINSDLEGTEPIIEIGGYDKQLKIDRTGELQTASDIILNGDNSLKLNGGSIFLPIKKDSTEGVSLTAGTITSLTEDTGKNADSITSLFNAIGINPTETLDTSILQQIKDINDNIGSEDKENSILGKLNSYNERLNDIEEDIGNNTTVTSIMGRIKKIEDALIGMGITL